MALLDEWYLRLLSPNASAAKPVKEYTLQQLLVKDPNANPVSGSPYETVISASPRQYPSGGVVLGRQSSTTKEDRKTRGFNSPIVSRNHAQLTVSAEGHVFITDLHSLHGTMIGPSDPNEPYITLEHYIPTQLLDGDTLVLGKSVHAENKNHPPIELEVEFARPIAPFKNNSRIMLPKWRLNDSALNFASIASLSSIQQALNKFSPSKGKNDATVSVHSVESSPERESGPYSNEFKGPAGRSIMSREGVYGVPRSILYDSSDEEDLPRGSVEQSRESTSDSDSFYSTASQKALQCLHSASLCAPGTSDRSPSSKSASSVARHSPIQTRPNSLDSTSDDAASPSLSHKPTLIPPQQTCPHLPSEWDNLLSPSVAASIPLPPNITPITKPVDPVVKSDEDELQYDDDYHELADHDELDPDHEYSHYPDLRSHERRDHNENPRTPTGSDLDNQHQEFDDFHEEDDFHESEGDHLGAEIDYVIEEESDSALCDLEEAEGRVASFSEMSKLSKSFGSGNKVDLPPVSPAPSHDTSGDMEVPGGAIATPFYTPGPARADEELQEDMDDDPFCETSEEFVRQAAPRADHSLQVKQDPEGSQSAPAIFLAREVSKGALAPDSSDQTEFDRSSSTSPAPRDPGYGHWYSYSDQEDESVAGSPRINKARKHHVLAEMLRSETEPSSGKASPAAEQRLEIKKEQSCSPVSEAPKKVFTSFSHASLLYNQLHQPLPSKLRSPSPVVCPSILAYLPSSPVPPELASLAVQNTSCNTTTSLDHVFGDAGSDSEEDAEYEDYEDEPSEDGCESEQFSEEEGSAMSEEADTSEFSEEMDHDSQEEVTDMSDEGSVCSEDRESEILSDVGASISGEESQMCSDEDDDYGEEDEDEENDEYSEEDDEEESQVDNEEDNDECGDGDSEHESEDAPAEAEAKAQPVVVSPVEVFTDKDIEITVLQEEEVSPEAQAESVADLDRVINTGTASATDPSTDSARDRVNPSPVTPSTPRRVLKRAREEDEIAEDDVTDSPPSNKVLKTAETDVKSVQDAPVINAGRNGGFVRSLGLIALGAVVGSVGTIAGLMQLAD